MEKLSQHDKIAQLHKDSSTGWVCGNEYRRNFIFSSHKRRGEMSSNHKDFKQRYAKYEIIRFEDRDCEHEGKNVKDYKLVLIRHEPQQIEMFAMS